MPEYMVGGKVTIIKTQEIELPDHYNLHMKMALCQ